MTHSSDSLQHWCQERGGFLNGIHQSCSWPRMLDINGIHQSCSWPRVVDMYIELIQWTHSVALINHLLSNPTGIPFLYNNSVFPDAAMVASVVNPATTPTALSNDSVSHGAVTQLLLNHLQRLLPYPTNILLENHGTLSNEYLTGESWNFDFGRYWSDGDIEGFRTDATFV